MQIQLGLEVEDLVSGLKGIAECRCQWLNGCVRIGVQPPIDKDGKLPSASYIDEIQLVVTGPGVTEKISQVRGQEAVDRPKETAPPAGDRSDPVRAADPTR